ncbi:MAG: helix-turn-helix transcriptional regulator [Pyrobaculum sp.]
MNITVALLLIPLSMWLLPIQIPPNYTGVIKTELPPICNATGTHIVEGPAVYTIVCVNKETSDHMLTGRVEVAYIAHQVPAVEQPPPPPPFLTVAVAAAAAAGLSHLLSNRRELLAIPIIPIVARIKKATAEDPVRREILKTVEEMGAATLSQIVKKLGKSWGAVQWHVYILEREGRLKSVKIGAFTYYFTNPKTAAEVILASVDPASLPPEEREKLDFLAAS